MTAPLEPSTVARAVERLALIEQQRTACALAAQGMATSEIAERMATSEARVRLMVATGRGAEEEPEEIILRAAVEGADRTALVERLSAITYTARRYAPDPFDGAVSGTWDQVRQAWHEGLLSDNEYEQVAAVARPADACVDEGADRR